jgi:hypothetical protein
MKSFRIVVLAIFFLLSVQPMSYAEENGLSHLELIVSDVHYKDKSLIVEGILDNTGDTIISNISKFTLGVYDSKGTLINGTTWENDEALGKVQLEPGHYENWSFEIPDSPQGDLTDAKVTYEAEHDEEFIATYNSGIHIFVNNEQLKTDVDPVMINNRTMVPMRAIFEQMGATVTYNQQTNTVTAKKYDITLTHKIGTKVFTVNGKNVTFDTASVLRQGRTMVPLRVIAESLNGTVFWGQTGNETTIGIAN